MEIDEYCKSKKIQWTASAWDLGSQDFIASLNVPFNKVASPMLGIWQLRSHRWFSH